MIRSDNRLATYLVPYKIQFFKKDIDFGMGREIKLSKKPNDKFNNLVLELSDVSHYIYTDGSKDKNRCGFGVYIENVLEASHRVNDIASIYSAEALAILYALRTIEINDLDNVVIFSDSLGVLKRLASIGLNSDNNLIISDIFLCLHNLLIEKNKNIKFVWIPSHVGIIGNDKADSLAKEALNNETIFYDKLHCNELKPLFRANTLRDMINYTKDYDFGKGLKGRKYIENNDEFSFNCWFDRYELDRKRIVIINRIKSSHVRTNDHLYRKNIVNSNLCECNEIQTLEHIIWECATFNNYRDSLILFLNSKGIMRGQDVSIIFNKSSINILLRIVFFILVSGIVV